MAWQTFRVQLKGQDEIAVETTARDWAAVRIDPGAARALDMTFQVVHHALLRTGAGVPCDYNGFLEVLADMPTAVDEGDADALDPTAQALLDGSQ